MWLRSDYTINFIMIKKLLEEHNQLSKYHNEQLALYGEHYKKSFGCARIELALAMRSLIIEISKAMRII